MSAPKCVKGSRSPLGVFQYQYQGGSADDGTLVLPPGTGIPVGARTGQKSLVVAFHFPDLNETIDRMAGGSELSLTLTRRQDTRHALTFSIEANGFVAPQSVGWVSGSAVSGQEIQPHVLFTHGHKRITDTKVWIVRRDGGKQLLLHQDLLSFRGFTPLPDPESAVIRRGDKVTIECWYNNSLSVPLRVQNLEMCIVDVTYSVVGGEISLLPTVFLSVDRVFKSCFPHPVAQKAFIGINDLGQSSFRPESPDLICA